MPLPTENDRLIVLDRRRCPGRPHGKGLDPVERQAYDSGGGARSFTGRADDDDEEHGRRLPSRAREALVPQFFLSREPSSAMDKPPPVLPVERQLAGSCEPEPIGAVQLPTLDDTLALLQNTFGYDRFRPGQEDIITALLAGENVLAVMPTGSGKSMCYQLPALATGSLSVVVSPLIALMRDQVAALRLNGVAAGALNSATPREDAAETHHLLRQGRLRLLYISPERLMQPKVLDGLARYGPARFAIDEAHCISQWGHDFRPDYRRLAELPEHFPDARVSAFTATADAVTRQDIVERLFAGRARVFVAGFDRPNLQIGIAPRNSAARQIDTVLDRHRGRSGIVYTLSRKEAERTAQRLSSHGRTALPYHAGMDQDVRDRNQDRFLTEDGVVMVATIAFGMGIDKPDVRFVVHANIPSTVEAYYQEIGRAGRDGLPAETLMFYGMGDIRLRRLMIDDSDRPEEVKRVEHQRLNALLALCETTGCRRQALLGYFGEACDPCGNCDRCLHPVETIDGLVIAQKAL